MALLSTPISWWIYFDLHFIDWKFASVKAFLPNFQEQEFFHAGSPFWPFLQWHLTFCYRFSNEKLKKKDRDERCGEFINRGKFIITVTLPKAALSRKTASWTKNLSKTSLMSTSFFEIFVKEVKCVGTSWAEISFDHQIFDKFSLFIDCFWHFWSVWTRNAFWKFSIPSVIGHAFYSPFTLRFKSLIRWLWLGNINYS